MVKSSHVTLAVTIILLAAIVSSAFLFTSKVSNMASFLIRLEGESAEADGGAIFEEVKSCDTLCKDSGYDYGACRQNLVDVIIDDIPKTIPGTPVIDTIPKVIPGDGTTPTPGTGTGSGGSIGGIGTDTGTSPPSTSSGEKTTTQVSINPTTGSKTTITTTTKTDSTAGTTTTTTTTTAPSFTKTTTTISQTTPTTTTSGGIGGAGGGGSTTTSTNVVAITSTPIFSPGSKPISGSLVAKSELEVEIGVEGCFNGEICNCGSTFGSKAQEETSQENVVPPELRNNNRDEENVEENTCTTYYECGEWSACIVSYDIKSVVRNDFTTLSWKERLCEPVSTEGCPQPNMPNKVDKEVCDKAVVLSFKSEDKCAVKQTILVDTSTGREVARLRPVFDGSPRFDIDIGEKLSSSSGQDFCWYCADGVKDYDETGVDCGGPSCQACGFEVRLAKNNPQYIYYSLIAILSAMITILIWLEVRNFREKDYKSLIFYNFRKIRR